MAPVSAKAITQADKQRAINNLRSEITRRARSLRSDYARAAQSLRSKLEMRIYRIPKAMRQANMGELLQKYLEMQDVNGKAAIKVKSPMKDATRAVPAVVAVKKSPKRPAATKKTVAKTGAATITAEAKAARASNATRARGVKRDSEIMIAADNTTDKENEAIENPKKRSKAGADTAPTRSMRDPSTILSPKSNNSRTLPQSPIRGPFGVPSKGFAGRPLSPLKPSQGQSSPVRQPTIARPATAAAAARPAASRATKATTASTRAAPTRGPTKTTAARAASNSSNTSNATTGTTIVRKGATSRAGTAASAAKKTTATAGTAASTRRTAATKAKAETAVAEAGTRRVLRKRA